MAEENLKIRSFLGRSENAVRIQIYVALIAFMLLRILHQTAARVSRPAPTAARPAQSQPAFPDRSELGQHTHHRPDPPACGPPHPRRRLAFK